MRRASPRPNSRWWSRKPRCSTPGTAGSTMSGRSSIPPTWPDRCWQPHRRAGRSNASSRCHNASACAFAVAVEDADQQRRASATITGSPNPYITREVRTQSDTRSPGAPPGTVKPRALRQREVRRGVLARRAATAAVCVPRTGEASSRETLVDDVPRHGVVWASGLSGEVSL
jgi:hypothetical protein